MATTRRRKNAPSPPAAPPPLAAGGEARFHVHRSSCQTFTLPAQGRQGRQDVVQPERLSQRIQGSDQEEDAPGLPGRDSRFGATRRRLLKHPRPASFAGVRRRRHLPPPHRGVAHLCCFHLRGTLTIRSLAQTPIRGAARKGHRPACPAGAMVYKLPRHAMRGMMINEAKALRKWLSGSGLNPVHYLILSELRLSSWTPAELVHRATSASRDEGGGWETTEDDVAEGIEELKTRRLIEEVTPSRLERIQQVFHSPKDVLGSDDVLPELGEISLTLRGAQMVVALFEDVFHMYPSSFYTFQSDASGRVRRIFGISQESVLQAIWDNRNDIVTFANVGPMYPIDSWRSDWWYLHQSGWAVDITYAAENEG